MRMKQHHREVIEQIFVSFTNDNRDYFNSKKVQTTPNGMAWLMYHRLVPMEVKDEIHTYCLDAHILTVIKKIYKTL
jgi:hypothetical protein